MYREHLRVGEPYLGMGRSWWLLLLFGMLSLLFGFVAILKPVETGTGITWGTGILALIEGVLTLLAVLRKDMALPRGWMLAYAVISLLFGMLAVVNPISMAASLVMVAGLWVLLAGLMRIALAIRVRKQVPSEWTLVLCGVLAVVLGALLLWTPVAGLILAVVWLGVGALVYGLLQIFAALRLRRVRG